MPLFTITQRFGWDRASLFAFFRQAKNVIALAPPEFHLTLVHAPEILQVGDQLTVKTRRFGLSIQIVSEVVELLDPERIVEEQRQGPFRKWRHERRFSAIGETETELCEQIEYEPPGGLLGRTLSAAMIERDLAHAYHWREQLFTRA
jgi:ligand-binding SRPBCC domain-containing protein